jgi:uncharacterized protein (TIGR02001 family)
MNKLSIIGLMAGFSLTSTYAAESPFKLSANVALSSDYIYRGMSQTNGSLAIQGGFDLEHNSGFYIGTWASNVDFEEENAVDRANAELDLYVGYSHAITDSLAGEVKAGRYLYPSASKELNYDMTEFYFALTYELPIHTEFTLSYDYSPEFGGEVGQAHHYQLLAEHELANGFRFGAHIAKQYIEDNEKAELDDYFHYGLEVGYTIAEVEFTLGFSNTDLDDAEELKADERLFITISKTF